MQVVMGHECALEQDDGGRIVSALYAKEAIASRSILITDLFQDDGPIAYCSPAFERHTGYTSNEVIGRNPRFLQGPDTSPAAVAMFRHIIQNGLSGTVHILNYKKSGEPFLHRVKLVPIWSKEGVLRAFLAEQSLDDGYLQSRRGG